MNVKALVYVPMPDSDYMRPVTFYAHSGGILSQADIDRLIDISRFTHCDNTIIVTDERGARMTLLGDFTYEPDRKVFFTARELAEEEQKAHYFSELRRYRAAMKDREALAGYAADGVDVPHRRPRTNVYARSEDAQRADYLRNRWLAESEPRAPKKPDCMKDEDEELEVSAARSCGR